MVHTAGQLHLFDKAGLAEVRVENKSLMPDDYARRLTVTEIQNVVAYLQTLTGRDLSKPLEVSIPGGLTSERVANAQAEPRNRLSYWGDVQGRHYSSLSQIDTSNVRQLQARGTGRGPPAATPEDSQGVRPSIPKPAIYSGAISSPRIRYRRASWRRPGASFSWLRARATSSRSRPEAASPCGISRPATRSRRRPSVTRWTGNNTWRCPPPGCCSASRCRSNSHGVYA